MQYLKFPLTYRPLLWLVVFLPFALNAQSYDWWYDLHDLDPDNNYWKRMMIISPGYLGPNALPVPETTKGVLGRDHFFAFSASHHFHIGDPTSDLSGKIYLPFADGKIAFELQGVIIEKYNFSDDIRIERRARVLEGKGTTVGDLYVTTHLQLSRDRKFPDTAFRFSARTTSGGDLKAARFSDHPGFYFDFSFSKPFSLGSMVSLRPYSMLGFHSWQTNYIHTLQNDALLYGAGADLTVGNYRVGGGVSGYSGYQKIKDRPQILWAQAGYDWKQYVATIDWSGGLRDWEYQTVRFTMAYKFSAGNGDNALR